jgi:cardiolipin synthase
MAADDPAPALHYRRALESLVGVPATDGNLVDILRNGAQAFPAMLEAIGAATATVDLLTFGHWSGSVGRSFAAALAERAAAGVRVRVLLDALGSGGIDRDLVGSVRSAGAQVEWFRPLTNWRVTQTSHRGHRKLLVCDGEVAFTGGVGIADEWSGDAGGPSEWRDTQVRVRGPAVNGLVGAFVNNWAETASPLFDEGVDRFPRQDPAGASCVQVVRGDAETGWGDISTLARSLLGLARHRVRISAGFFVPDDGTLEVLAEAARRGVAVDVLRPGRQQSALSRLASQAQYDRLLRAGVRVWSFQPTAFHVRAVTVDATVASLGAVNFNSRSLTLDDEVNVVVVDHGVARLVDDHFEADLERSAAVDPARWSERDLAQRAKELVPGFLARRL